MKSAYRNIKVLAISLFIISAFAGCTVRIGERKFGYTFSGANTGNAQTASVQYFQNRASIVQPTLALRLTDKLKDKIESQTSLKIVNGNNADVNFEGSIENYVTQPTAVSGGQEVTATLNRLTVTIEVKYTNTTDQQFEYDSQFSRYVDYPASWSLEQAESEKLDEVISLLVDDIFNKAFVNW